MTHKPGVFNFLKAKYLSYKPKELKIGKDFERLYTEYGEICCYFSDIHPLDEKRRNNTKKKSDITIVYFHGNASNAVDTTLGCKIMRNKLNVNFIVFEYPGYGERGGVPSKHVIIKDFENNCWPIIKKKAGDGKIFFYGISLGAAVVLHTRFKNETSGIILHNPFSSIEDMIDKMLDRGWIGWAAKILCTEDWDNVERIKGLRVPCLIVCGTMDKLIPMKQKEKLKSFCKTECEIIKYPGGHCSLFRDEVWRKIKYWMDIKSLKIKNE